MSYFKKTNIFKQIIFSKGAVVVLLFLIIFTGFSLYSVIGKSMDASKQRKIAETEVTDLQSKQAELSKKIDMLKTPDGQSAVLKEQYPVVSPGEHVVVITDDSGMNSTTTSQTEQPQQKSFWQYVKSLFKK